MGNGKKIFNNSRMKVALVCLIFVAASMAEPCGDDNHHSCTDGNHHITTCNPSGWDVHCIDHQCTCTSTSGGSGTGGAQVCSKPDTCPQCDHGNRHCIDSKCRCTQF